MIPMERNQIAKVPSLARQAVESRSRSTFAFLSVLLLTGCAANGIFYYPNRRLYWEPEKMGLKYETVVIHGLRGADLSGALFPTGGKPKGTIVHFHGNFGNLSNHFPQSMFLLDYGYDVLIFDYEGFGASEGRPTPRNTVEDGMAAVQWAKDHCRASPARVGVFGQSVGAAVACVTAARDPSVDAVVLEAPFTSYRAITADVLKRCWFTWPLLPFFPVLFVRRGCDPEDYIADIAPRPVFIIHGDKDRTVPVKMGKRLYALAKDPKFLWIVPGACHLGCRQKGGKEYEEKITRFFDAAFKGRD